MTNILIIIFINSVLFSALYDILYFQIKKKEERYVKMPK